MVCTIWKAWGPLVHTALQLPHWSPPLKSCPFPHFLCQTWKGFLHIPNPNLSHSCFLLGQQNEGQTPYSTQWVHQALTPPYVLTTLHCQTLAWSAPMSAYTMVPTVLLTLHFHMVNSCWASKTWLGSHHRGEAFPDTTSCPAWVVGPALCFHIKWVSEDNLYLC